MQSTRFYITASDGAQMGSWKYEGGLSAPHTLYDFGASMDLLSSSHGIYTSIYSATGSNQGYDDDGNVPGRVYVNRWDPSAPFTAPDKAWVVTMSAGDFEKITVAGTDQYYPMMGLTSCALISGTNALYLAPSQRQGGTVVDQPGPFIWALQDNGSTVVQPSSMMPSSSFAKNYVMGGNGACTPFEVNQPVPGTSNFGTGMDLLSGTSDANDFQVMVGAPHMAIDPDTGICETYYGAAILFSGTFTPYSSDGFIASASWSDRVYDYKQNGKLFGLAIEETLPNSITAQGAYDPAYCAYTPPNFYGTAKTRISFQPPQDDDYTLQDIFDGIKYENSLEVIPDRMAVINSVRSGLTALQKKVKMPVSASVNLEGKFFEPGVIYDASTGQATTVDGTSVSPKWVISTRFESPVIDTKNPKYDELYTANNNQITGTYGWQEFANPQVLITGKTTSGIAVDPESEMVYYTDYAADKVYRMDYNGANNTELASTIHTVARNISLDLINRKMYWVVDDGGLTPQPKLEISNMDAGSPVTTIDISMGLTSATWGCFVDASEGYVYYTIIADGEGIYRRDLDGTNPVTVLSLTSGAGLRSIVVDTSVSPRKIYYTTVATPKGIYRCDADGSNVVEIVPDSLFSAGQLPMGLSMDPLLRKLYFTIYNFTGDDFIRMCNLDGTQIENIIHYTPGSQNPNALAIDPISQHMFWTNNAELTISKAKSFLHLQHNPRTMWTSYGTVPADNKGITFELAESFPENTDPATGSLIDALSFIADTKDVGRVRQTKEISEAVMVIPYLDYALQQDVPPPFPNADPYFSITQDLTIPFYEKNFFRIPSWNFQQQKVNLETQGVAVPSADNIFGTGSAITSTTVTDLIQSMKKYVIPPDIDFVAYPDIDPFVAYILEFNHTLQQKELTDIWQGVMPDSALKATRDEVSISHKLGPYQFFGNIVDKKVLGDMKFFVFKIKKRGANNYYKITADAQDDARFAFKFSGDATDSAIPIYSYNWPYDFFSLVEKAKIEAKFTLKKKGGG